MLIDTDDTFLSKKFQIRCLKYILWGHNFSDPILVDQVLVQEVPHNEFFCRVWAKELSFSELKRFVA